MDSAKETITQYVGGMADKSSRKLSLTIEYKPVIKMKREVGEDKTGRERFTSADILKRIPQKIQRD